VHAVVFDFDGVIADTEPLHLAAAQEVLAEEGHLLAPSEYAERYLGLDDITLFRRFASDRHWRLPEGEIAALVERKARRLERMLADGVVLFPGVEERIRAWADQVPLAIASGALGREIDIVLTAAELIRFFPIIVSADSGVRGKPSPDPYLLAVELLSSSHGPRIEHSRTIAIEDSTKGIAAARAAGLRVIAVTNTLPALDLREAELVVSSLEELTLEDLRRLCS
jgi:beta-phosphoglucomutase